MNDLSPGNTLEELFNRNPLEHTPDSIRRIVAELRALREKWKDEPKVPKAEKAPKGQKTKINLGDLGL